VSGVAVARAGLMFGPVGAGKGPVMKKAPLTAIGATAALTLTASGGCRLDERARPKPIQPCFDRLSGLQAPRRVTGLFDAGFAFFYYGFNFDESLRPFQAPAFCAVERRQQGPSGRHRRTF
jgi:hypothetical protein